MKILLACVVAFATACGASGDDKMAGRADARQPLVADTTVSSGPAVVFVGTSLTAGLGLTPEMAYPAVIQRIARSEGIPVSVVNAGLSGETSAGALRRIDWILRNPADVFVIETGANDGLRGLDVRATYDNISALVGRIHETAPQARVLLVQMEAPPNLGADYTMAFRNVYQRVARERGVTLVPFLLDGVAAVPALNQPDGIHPNAAGAERIAANVWPHLRAVVTGLLGE